LVTLEELLLCTSLPAVVQLLPPPLRLLSPRLLPLPPPALHKTAVVGVVVSVVGSLRHKLVGPALCLHAEEAEVLAGVEDEEVTLQLLHVGQ
jgi:hypothetical protein